MTPAKTLMAVLLLVLAGAGAGVALYSLMKEADENPVVAGVVPVTIENLRLSVPQTYFRSGILPRSVAVERIDLVAKFPAMAAAGIPTKASAGKLAPDQRQLVFLAIMRGDGVIDPAERPQDIYGRFLEPDVWDNPGGLIMRRFAADSPYGDEELFMSPPDGRRFAARCRKPGKTTEEIGETCLWRFRRSGADIQIRFSPDLLTQWEILEQGLAGLLKGWSSQ
ncbi:MAG: hypothetical protein ACRCWF_02570 [Beijerinckiaceae bacterium]